MTFIQSEKKNFVIIFILAVLSLEVVLGTIWLIIFYNRTVELSRGADNLKVSAQKLEAQNAALKEQIFSFFTTDRVDQFAHNSGLIQERNPQYISTSKQWASASLY